MLTPIDYGKNFLQTLYNERNAEGAAGYLADDLVWVTPDEIRHLKSREDILAFLRLSVQDDPELYNVDIASIKSAPGDGESNIVVYDVNLIPRREEDAVNIRCSLCIRKTGIETPGGFTLTFVGMSRRYQRTETEQIREFIENLPGGVMVLVRLGAGELRHLYSNTFLPKQLGYEEGLYFDKLGENPFFMMPDRQMKRMRTMIAQLSSVSGRKTAGIRTELLSADGKEKPFHVSIGAAYKDGPNAIFYIIFDEIAQLAADYEHQEKRAVKKARQLQHDEDEKEFSKVLQQADETVKTAAAAADNAIRDAVQTAEDSVKEELLDLRTKAQQDEEARETAESALKSLQEEYGRFEEISRKNETQYQQRILKLQREADEVCSKLTADFEDRKKELEEKAEEGRVKLEEETQRKRKETAEAAAKERQGFLGRIAALEEENERLQAELRDRDLGIEKTSRDRILLTKEKDKSLERLGRLAVGQMNSIRSIARSLEKETSPVKRRRNLEQIIQIAENMPAMADDLTAVSNMNLSGRLGDEEEFSVAECVDTVRKVMWPMCRRKGIIFSCEMQEEIHDRVRADKAGLLLACLTILENAAANTAGGGSVKMTCTADQPIREKAYYYFVIEDTGSGIPDDTLPILFDDPTGELSIARRIVSLMGGSIQVRSHYGTGTRFEIKVNMTLA